ncbi:MAG TPA: hypothetical protein VKZ60_03515 [Chloroflexota bacterium]|jgi:hypothetical protein|nr:hypothetical protein [Chloroflexota bacterium]
MNGDPRYAAVGAGDVALPTFAPTVRAALAADGWLFAELPGGLTLEGLRASGAPFKGERYFTRFAHETVEYATVAAQVAYRPALLPGTLGLRFEDALARVARLTDHLPAGVVATAAPAAAYVWLFEAHYARYGAYPFVQCYTWAVDCYQQRAHLVVGVFGRHRPLLVAPHTEGYGAGVGLWPLLLPGAVADLLWPLAPRRAAPPR